jgi:hypothetical protein
MNPFTHQRHAIWVYHALLERYQQCSLLHDGETFCGHLVRFVMNPGHAESKPRQPVKKVLHPVCISKLNSAPRCMLTCIRVITHRDNMWTPLADVRRSSVLCGDERQIADNLVAYHINDVCISVRAVSRVLKERVGNKEWFRNESKEKKNAVE